MQKRWRHDLRYVRWLFVATMLFLVSVLGVLVWRINAQESALIEQRARTYQESAADRIVATLHQQLGAIDAALEVVVRTGDRPPIERDDSVVMFLSPDAARAWPRDRLAFFPDNLEAPSMPDARFGNAEELEYRRRDFAGAIAEYERLTMTAEPHARAMALAGVARNQLNANQPEAALATYGRLQNLEAGSVAGLPPGLAGRLGSLAVYRRQKVQSKAIETAAAIRADLLSHRYLLSRAAFSAAWGEAAGVESGRGAGRPAGFADAIAEFWKRNQDAPAGRLIIGIRTGEQFLLCWRRRGSDVAVFAMRVAAIPRDWLASDVMVELVGEGDRAVVRSGEAGMSKIAGPPSIRLGSTTRLPWTVQVSASVPAAEAVVMQSRQRLLLAGLGVLIVLIAAAGWVVGRAVTREVALARMQAGFVAGVSHEFRTPLTALIQTSELLIRGRVASEEERAGYYLALHAESRRLHRLVENLLMFGGLDAGQVRFKTQAIDARALVAETIEQCVRANPSAANRIQSRGADDVSTARGDREALQMMLANLIDNGLKYSPADQPVVVSIGPAPDGGVRIEVADRGMGIPPAERDKIFDDFVRGAAALERQIRGTGVGLALAREIARAHGGDITVESEPGAGSRFVVRLA